MAISGAEFKMKTMFLFGAGASIKAGIPDAYEMTKKLLSLFANDIRFRKYYRVLSFIVGGLLFQKAKSGINPYDGVNVEEVFNAILLLADRQTLEVAPFVGSWDEMVDRLDRSTKYSPNISKLNEEIYKSVAATISQSFPTASVSFSENKLDTEFQHAIESKITGRGSFRFQLGRAVHEYLKANMEKWFDVMKRGRPSSSTSFGREFSRAIQANDEIPAGGQVFDDAAELMIINLINFVWLKEPTSVSYLTPLLSFYKKQEDLCIATLNYDNAIELMCSSTSTNYSTGIEGWSKTGEFKKESDGIFLLKLHGSIDWELERGVASMEQPMPHSEIKIVSPTDAVKKYYRPAVIFGQRNKLTAEGPFLDLIRAFQKELSQTENIIIAGYSFRDSHINEYLTQWLNNSNSRKMIIVDPSASSIESNFVRYLRNLDPIRVEFREEKIEDALPTLCQKE